MTIRKEHPNKGEITPFRLFNRQDRHGGSWKLTYGNGPYAAGLKRRMKLNGIVITKLAEQSDRGIPLEPQRLKYAGIDEADRRNKKSRGVMMRKAGDLKRSIKAASASNRESVSERPLKRGSFCQHQSAAVSRLYLCC